MFNIKIKIKHIISLGENESVIAFSLCFGRKKDWVNLRVDLSRSLGVDFLWAKSGISLGGKNVMPKICI